MYLSTVSCTHLLVPLPASTSKIAFIPNCLPGVHVPPVISAPQPQWYFPNTNPMTSLRGLNPPCFPVTPAQVQPCPCGGSRPQSSFLGSRPSSSKTQSSCSDTACPPPRVHTASVYLAPKPVAWAGLSQAACVRSSAGRLGAGSPECRLGHWDYSETVRGDT